jgi:hypothetical protein
LIEEHVLAAVGELVTETVKKSTSWSAGEFKGAQKETHVNRHHGVAAVHELEKHEHYVAYCRMTGRAATSTKRQQTIQQMAAAGQRAAQAKAAVAAGGPLAARVFNMRENQIIGVCRTYVPFNTVEDAFNRAVLEGAGKSVGAGDPLPLLSRKRLSEETRALAPVLEKEVLDAHFKCRVVSLAIDSGTVWKRFLAIVAHTSDVQRAVLLALTPDFQVDARPEDDDDEAQDLPADHVPHLTIATMLAHVREVIKKFEATYGCLVLAVSTDNASSMVGLCRELRVFDQRCGCHGVQLLVEALMDPDTGVPSVFGAKHAAETFLAAVLKLTPAVRRNSGLHRISSVVATRWNGWLDVMREIKCAQDNRTFFGAGGERRRCPAAQRIVAEAHQGGNRDPRAVRARHEDVRRRREHSPRHHRRGRGAQARRP